MNFEHCTDDTLKIIIYKTAFEANATPFIEEDINGLYAEAYNRKLYRPDILLNMHSWSLYNLNKGTRPRYRVDAMGNYWVRAY